MKKHVMSFLAAVFLLPVFFGCMPHTTGETEIGVRTRKIAIFGDKGVEDKAYEDKLYSVLGFTSLGGPPVKTTFAPAEAAAFPERVSTG